MVSQALVHVVYTMLQNCLKTQQLVHQKNIVHEAV